MTKKSDSQVPDVNWECAVYPLLDKQIHTMLHIKYIIVLVYGLAQWGDPPLCSRNQVLTE